MLKIPLPVFQGMIAQARADRPIESCGYLAGLADGVVERIPMTNVDQSAEHFCFDPREQFQAVKAARAKGLDLIAVYHSHPATPARLSAEDLRLANDPRVYYLIVSLQNPEEPVVRAFTVAAGEALEIQIEITEG